MFTDWVKGLVTEVVVTRETEVSLEVVVVLLEVVVVLARVAVRLGAGPAVVLQASLEGVESPGELNART